MPTILIPNYCKVMRIGATQNSELLMIGNDFKVPNNFFLKV